MQCVQYIYSNRPVFPGGCIPFGTFSSSLLVFGLGLHQVLAQPYGLLNQADLLSVVSKGRSRDTELFAKVNAKARIAGNRFLQSLQCPSWFVESVSSFRLSRQTIGIMTCVQLYTDYPVKPDYNR